MKLSKTTLAALALFVTVLQLHQINGTFNERSFLTIFVTFFTTIISSLLIFVILIRVTRFTKYGIIGVISHVSWVFLFTDFSMHDSLTLFVFLLVIFSLLESTAKKKYFYSFLSGLFGFFLLILNQSFWVISLTLLTFHLLRKNNKKFINFMYAVYGLLWGIILFVSYLYLTKSFNKFIFRLSNNSYWKSYDFDLEIFNNYNSFGLIDVTFFIDLVSYVFLISSLFSLFTLIYRKRFHLTFIPLTFLLLLINIFLRPISHSDNLILLSLNSVPLSIIMNQIPTVFIKICCYFVIIFITIIGIYFTLFT